MLKILLIEDNTEIAQIICDYLNKRAYSVTWASTGTEGLADFARETPSLLIVDLMLPELDGYTVCKNVRMVSDVPIIILSAKDLCEDKVKGLKLGADDYMTKPFSLVELDARIESQLNRYIRYENKTKQSVQLEYKNGLSINAKSKTVLLDATEIQLTAKEFALLLILAKNPHRTLTKKELYEHVWQELDTEGNNTVTVHIRALREKLQDSSKTPNFIQTIWGIGYRFVGEKLS